MRQLRSPGTAPAFSTHASHAAHLVRVRVRVRGLRLGLGLGLRLGLGLGLGLGSANPHPNPNRNPNRNRNRNPNPNPSPSPDPNPNPNPNPKPRGLPPAVHERARVGHDDHAPLRTREQHLVEGAGDMWEGDGVLGRGGLRHGRHVQPPRVRDEAERAAAVGADRREEDELLLAALEAVDALDLHRVPAGHAGHHLP